MYTSPFFKEFPEIKEKNKGKFTAWAKKNGFKTRVLLLVL